MYGTACHNSEALGWVIYKVDTALLAVSYLVSSSHLSIPHREDNNSTHCLLLSILYMPPSKCGHGSELSIWLHCNLQVPIRVERKRAFNTFLCANVQQLSTPCNEFSKHNRAATNSPVFHSARVCSIAKNCQRWNPSYRSGVWIFYALCRWCLHFSSGWAF